MARAHLKDAVDTHLRRIGTDLPSFIQAALDRGASPAAIADDIKRHTDIEVHTRSVYRWIEDLGIERAAS